MIKKLYIKTWGCQINEYDSDRITSHLKETKEYIMTSSLYEADLIILNTCSVRYKTQKKLYDMLGRIKQIKCKKKLIVAVGGCVAVQEKSNLFLFKNVVDIIFTPKSIDNICNLLKGYEINKCKVIDLKQFNQKKYFYYNSQHKKSLSYVPIMEGCNKFCSYCIVPYTRGREVSRNPEDIILEICNLSKIGVKEIKLLGHNVNAYDGIFKNGKKCNFSFLLHLISEIDSIQRISFISSHPNNFTKDVIDAYKRLPKIVDTLHLPVQSGSNKILKLMGRQYSIEDYKKIIFNLLEVRPKMLFSSDFIIGFPGEKDSDFNLTLKLINDIKFDNGYAFIYSPRPGTAALNIKKDKVDILEKKNRLYKIQKLLKNNYYFWSRKLLHTTQSVLVEGYSKRNKNFLFGRTFNGKIVYLQIPRTSNMLGNIINVNINKFENNCLYGEVIS